MSVSLMQIDHLIPYRWRNRRAAARHVNCIKDILDTQPIVPRDDGLVIFSMIGSSVVLPYLVAVKSLWSRLRRGRIVLLDDGSLTANDKAILTWHCGDPEIIPISSVATEGFPKGGCWERLLTILDHRRAEYWIQLDSDTVTIGPVHQVSQAIASNRSFTLLGGSDAEIGLLTLRDFVQHRYPAGPSGNHIQAQIEARLGEIEQGNYWRYIRGCAGFAGFAAGGPDRSLAQSFIQGVTPIMGCNRMQEWGTEQVASNFLIANDTDPVLLTYSHYFNYWGEAWHDDAAFIHFVGTYRYHQDAYEHASRIAIDQFKLSAG